MRDTLRRILLMPVAALIVPVYWLICWLMVGKHTAWREASSLIRVVWYGGE